MNYIQRVIPVEKTLKSKSILLFGPRRTGKSALLKNQVHADRSFDLLKSDIFQRLSSRPSSIRESLRDEDKIIVIDEIQKLPNLMDEVHSMIEDHGLRFLLTGSSARKLKKSHTSLMAGRATTMHLHPFRYPEISDGFDLKRVLHLGTLPPVFLQESESASWSELQDYAGDYLKEEIMAEAIVRKIEAFSRFLSVAAQTNGELLNYEAVANDAQVPSRTIREYFSVLEDTLIGKSLQPLRFKGKKSRKSISTAKFYFFDCGVLNSLLSRKSLSADSPEFGNLFETWVFQELMAYGSYFRPRDHELNFWRSPSGDEVDIVINGEIGIEVKATRSISERHLKGLSGLEALTKLKRRILVCREPEAKKIGNTEVLPWEKFMKMLWDGKIF